MPINKGDSLSHLLAHSPNDLARAKEYWGRALGGESLSISQQFGDPLIKRNWYELHFSPTRDMDGNIVGATHILHDISDRKRSEESLLCAKNLAEEAVRVKSRFLDIAAHELRTPVTTFSMLLQYTEKQLEKGHPVDAATIARLRSQTQRLSRLVIDLFEVSRLEHEGVALHVEPTSITSLILECLDGFRIQEPERKFVFDVPTQSVEIDMDRAKIMQVLSNLLDNAVKYAETETPIEVRLETTSDVLRVSVIDRGVGISSEQKKTLFEPLARGTSDQVEQTSGLGLGLFICRSIVELHGGRVGVESNEGAGSTFYFELPRKTSARKAA